MSKIGWIASTEGTVALAAATAKTALNVIAPANKGVTCVGFKVDFDGVTASALPVLVEVMRSTQAGAGTSSAVTVRRKRGPVGTIGATAAKNYSAEPTSLTLVEDYSIDPYKGLFAMQYPLGREIDVFNGEGVLIRCNAPATVNVRAWLEFEEG